MTRRPATAEAAGMPAARLRDNCPCPQCRDPLSGRRLLHITDVPADIAVPEVARSMGQADAATCGAAVPIPTASKQVTTGKDQDT
jgi:uncharacterized Zn-binding protein involved in type VI secretion